MYIKRDQLSCCISSMLLLVQYYNNIFISVTANKDSRKVEAKHQMEGIKLPLIVELGVDPNTGKPIIMSICPAIKLGK